MSYTSITSLSLILAELTDVLVFATRTPAFEFIPGRAGVSHAGNDAFIGLNPLAPGNQVRQSFQLAL